MADLRTPDSIGSVSRTQTDLTPAAQSISVYQGGARRDVPEPPQTNRYSQLGAALEKFSATTGVQSAQDTIKKQIENDTSEGAVKAQQLAKDMSLKNLNEAVADGRIPAGASPAFIFAMKANFLKLRGEQSQMRFREDYYANAELRNTDDPAAFPAWAHEWASHNETAILKNTLGDQQYSALEIAHSNFNERVSDGQRAVEQEHIAHRISEREQLGEQATSGLMAVRLESQAAKAAMDSGDYETPARMLVDVGYSATTGAATYGMNKSKVADMMRESLVAKAVADKDPRWLRVAESIKTPGSTLAHTGKAVAQFEAAREHIAGEIEKERVLREADAVRLLVGTPDERVNIAAARVTADNNEFNKTQLVHQHTVAALQVEDFRNMTVQERQKFNDHLTAISQVDPEAAIGLSLRLMEHGDKFQTAENKDKFPLAEIELRNLILQDPGSSRTHKAIDQKLADKAIGLEQAHILWTLSDQTGQEGSKYAKLLNSQGIKDLEKSVGEGVKQSPEDVFGASAILAGSAKLKFRQLVIETAKANPNMSPLQIEALVEPHTKLIAGRFNDTLKQVMEEGAVMQKGRDAVVKEALRLSQPEVQKQVREQVAKAEAQTKQIAEADKAGKPVVPQVAAPTKFGPKNEAAFAVWKDKYAKHSKSTDEQLRMMFKEGLKPQ